MKATWLNNLAQFFTDLRYYGVSTITPTAVFTGNWSGSFATCDGCKPYVSRSVVSCGVTKTLNFFPWMPFGAEIANFFPDQQDNNDGYNCAAATPADIWWGWQPFFNLVDAILQRAQAASLSVSDFDIENELNFFDFTVTARLIYDNTHFTDVLGTIRQLMWNRGFDGGRVTASAIQFRTNKSGFNCGSVYGDSASLIDVSAMLGAIAGGPLGGRIGLPTNIQWTYNLPCGGSVGSMTSLPISHSSPTVINLHNHMCVEGDANGNGSGCNPVADVTGTSTVLYNDLWSLLYYRGLTGTNIVFGETTTNQNCENHTTTQAQQSGTGYRNSALWLNHGSKTSLRPWNNIAHSCYVAPSDLNSAYNPFY